MLPLRILANIRLHIHRFDFAKGWFPVVKMVTLLVLYVFLIKGLNEHAPALIKELFKDDKPNLQAIIPALGTAGLVMAALFFLAKFAEVTGNPFKSDLQKFVNTPNYEGNVAFIEAFHRDFKDTVNILAGGKDKIYVFIDDLDRADIPKAAELMQGLNMMISDSPKLVFIIGMDREKVAAGVAAKYKDFLPFIYPNQPVLTTPEGLVKAREFGYQFLEKFIQLSFQIPRPSPAFVSRFIKSLSDGTPEAQGEGTSIVYNPVYLIGHGEDSDQFRKVTELLAPFFDDNPRRIKQFVNIFRLRAHIAHSTGLFNDSGSEDQKYLTIPQLGKFTAIAILFPQFMDEISANASLFKEKLLPGNYSREGDLQNQQVEDILFLEPATLENRAEYDMNELNIISLLQTMPPFRHDQTGAQPRQSATSPSSAIPNTPPAPPPSTGTTTTTTTTTRAPRREFDDSPNDFDRSRSKK